MLRSEVLELMTTYGAGLLTSWTPVLAVLTTQGNLLLYRLNKAELDEATKLASGGKPSLGRGFPSPPHVLQGFVAVHSPHAPDSASHVKGGGQASPTAQGASSSLPAMPPLFEPTDAVVLANATVEPAPSAGPAAWELCEYRPFRGLASLVRSSSAHHVTLRASSASLAAQWTVLLRKMATRTLERGSATR